MADEVQHLVVDMGSTSLRLGWAGDDVPSRHANILPPT
jgi:actin-related protein